MSRLLQSRGNTFFCFEGKNTAYHILLYAGVSVKLSTCGYNACSFIDGKFVGLALYNVISYLRI